MADTAQFPLLFDRLKSILQSQAGHLRILDDQPGKFALLGPYFEEYHKDVSFGMVEIRKNYVSFHLMPVYMYPELLDGISAGLKRRMQGKSCFNFTAIDEPLLAELADLTARCVRRFRPERTEPGS
jgi:hypothetical protein